MGELDDLPIGCATSVGPVPFADPDEATAFALSSGSCMPTAPIVASVGGSLLAQAVEGVPGVEVTPPGLLRVDPELFDPSLRRDAGLGVDGPAHGALRTFLSRVDTTHAGVRLAALGPVTVSMALRAAGVHPDQSGPLATHVVRRRVGALLDAARSVTDGVVLVALSEPGLIGAMHPTFPLTPTEVRLLLDPIVCELDAHPSAGSLLIGVHVPGRTDWETVLATGVSLISAPAGRDVVGWAGPLADFLDRGGRVAWGAVPVDQPLGSGEEMHWRRLSALWCELVAEGLDPLVLRNRSLISPADGLGHFGASQARLVVDLVDSLSTRVRRQAIGARLTLGA